MNIFKNVMDALFHERHSTTITVTLPTNIFMAVETLVYLRNETNTEQEINVDRDYIIGVALARYLQRHLYDKNEEKIASIPVPSMDDAYTNGRRQSRSPSP